MLGSSERVTLKSGGVIGAHFKVPGQSDEELAGFLSWDPKDGAVIDLVDYGTNWPRSFDLAPFLIHGLSSAGTRLSLFNARVKTLVGSEHASQMHSPILVWEGHELPERKWPRAFFSTLNLTTWRNADSVSRNSSETEDDNQTSISWQAPNPLSVELDDETIHIESRATTRSSGESVSIESFQRARFDPLEPKTTDQFRNSEGSTLLSFISFASDGPDHIVEEIYFDPESRERVEVWRWNDHFANEPTRSGRFLFRATDLAEPWEAIFNWWSLSERVRPALGLFADHLNQGRSYSPGRLITLFSAMEGYSRSAHSTTNFKQLRDFSGVPRELIEATNESFSLLGASRGYFTHLEVPSRKYTVAELESSTVDSIRRGSALMQSCLLRDLGLDIKTTSDLLKRHYTKWPLPPAKR